MIRSELKQIHRHTANHREEILRSSRCFCIYCEGNFQPGEIEDWIDNDRTALCPNCGIDAVVGDSCGFEITTSLLHELHIAFFSENDEAE